LKLRKVLILHKKSTFQIQAIEHRESRFLKLLEEGSEVVERVKLAHNEHVQTLTRLENDLTRRKIEFQSIARAELKDRVTDVDLMIAVGGDGTFLDASHSLEDVPLLGINSSSSSSFGHFCLASQQNFCTVLDDIEADRLRPVPLLRLELILKGSPLPEQVLNEVLVSHSNPAATSRYFLGLNEPSEEQRSSGIWIGTPAGSTGSLRSAGGTVLDITDDHFQFLVREPYMRPKHKRFEYLRGLLDRNQELHVVSQMRTGIIYIDGQHIDYQFGLGDELVVRASPTSLNAFIATHVNDIFR
jgi:NAD+ kinase